MALHVADGSLGVDCAHRAGVDASAAVDAGVCRDNPFVASLADSVDRAGIVTGAAVDALVGNGMCQSIHLLLFELVVYVSP